MSKYTELFKQYSCCKIAEEQVKQDVEKIIKKNFDKNNNIETYKTIFGLIDLTSLNSTDTEAQIKTFTEKANKLTTTYNKMPNVAAICVYPAMVSVVKETLTQTSIDIASVAAGFPAPQTFIEVKIAETAMAVMEGASEIDMVFPLDKFLDGNLQEVTEQISEIKAACRDAKLKVILETGALKTAENIAKAAVLSLASGADFIKTSTGKMPIGATLEAAYLMCLAFKEFNEKGKVKIGFKAAGGIVSTDEAVNYYTIVDAVLGKEYLNKDLFRIGASRLANNLITAVYGKEEMYF
jgi:deoxyribose-phosphate aldolase